MDERQAQELAMRIKHEIPYIITELTIVTAVGGWMTWAVNLYMRNSVGSLDWKERIESPSEWDERKHLFPPSPTSTNTL